MISAIDGQGTAALDEIWNDLWRRAKVSYRPDVSIKEGSVKDYESLRFEEAVLPKNRARARLYRTNPYRLLWESGEVTPATAHKNLNMAAEAQKAIEDMKGAV